VDFAKPVLSDEASEALRQARRNAHVNGRKDPDLTDLLLALAKPGTESAEALRAFGAVHLSEPGGELSVMPFNSERGMEVIAVELGSAQAALLQVGEVSTADILVGVLRESSPNAQAILEWLGVPRDRARDVVLTLLSEVPWENRSSEGFG
jgi:hypothetical protein